METRGRGREARSDVDEIPSSNPVTTSSDPTPSPPSTRSRTRLHTRSTRASSIATSGALIQRVVTRPRRVSLTRRSASDEGTQLSGSTHRRDSAFVAAHPSHRPTSSPLARPHAGRKRNRSSGRRPLGFPSSAGQAPSARQLVSSSSLPSAASPSAPVPNVALSARPFKRPRRASPVYPRTAAHLLPGERPLINPEAVKGSTSRDMDSPNDTTGRHMEGNEQHGENDNPSLFGSDRTGSHALRGLLRRLGGDLGDIFPGSVGTSHSRLQQLRTLIASPHNDEQQLDALSELCEFFSVGTEESLVSFSVNLFVLPLVDLLRTGTNTEGKIYAARALTHMMEALPSSSASVASHGAAEPLCQNLLSIEYMDLAEQSLSALHKLSFDFPQQIVQANGFQAVLAFIDFFSLGVQRVAAATACNLCRLPRNDSMEMICAVLPTMMTLLESEDQRIRESAVLGFARLAESFRWTSTKLDALCGNDRALIPKVLGLIVPTSPPALAPRSYASALRLLATLSRGSASLGMRILSSKPLIQKLKMKLSPASSLHSTDCLVLADSLLPDIVELERSPSLSGRSRRRRGAGSGSAFAAVDTKRREHLNRNVEPLRFFGQTLFTTLMKYYVSSADSNARRIALLTMSKYVSISPAGVLLDVVVEREAHGTCLGQKSNTDRFCPFIAALLGENNSPCESLFGLAMADAALLKIPSLQESFVREGVVHGIVRLAACSGGTQMQSEEGAEAMATTLPPVSEAAAPVEVQGERDPRPANHAVQGPAVRSMESVWSAVAILQRAAMHRGSRGEPAPSSLHASPRALEMCFPDLESLLPKAARSVLRSRLGAHEDGSVSETVLQNTMLGRLAAICDLLVGAKIDCDEAKGLEALSNLCGLLTASPGLTVFEIAKSGVMKVLAEFLSPSDSNLRYCRMVSLMEHLNKNHRRQAFSRLVDLALGVLSSEENLSVRTTESPLTAISTSVGAGLRQLAQPFKLRLRRSAPQGIGNLRDYSHHVVLIEPLATMSSVEDFLWPRIGGYDSDTETCNDAGASIAPKRRGQETGDLRIGQLSGPGGQGGEASTLAYGGLNRQATEGIDDDRSPGEGIVDTDGEHNDKGRDDLAEDEDNHDVNHSDDEASSGDEIIDEQMRGSSDQDSGEADMFDVDRLSTSLPPLELDHDALVQPPSLFSRSRTRIVRGSATEGGSASREAIDPALTFRSYAAALAANIRGSPNRVSAPTTAENDVRRRTGHGNIGRMAGGSALPLRRLSFAINGKTIPHECSILSAVIQSSADEDCGIGTRLWSDVHTLVYSKAEIGPEGGGVVSQGSKAVTKSADSKLHRATSTERPCPLRRSQRLMNSREKGQTSVVNSNNIDYPEGPISDLWKVTVANDVIPVPRKGQMAELPASITSVIEVLRQLHWIHTNMGDNYFRRNEGARIVLEAQREDTDVQFYCHKLSAKLVRQLSDPVALCGGVVPSWCFSLARDASFLIPFETRRILFQSTSLGIARALHLLQTRVDSSGVPPNSHRTSVAHRETETRIGRIQRQKVRLHRNRILESAIKVMNMYGAHSTILEVEYFDEAGTGLGPTLEFYTLVSREIQRIDLALWRGDRFKVPAHVGWEKQSPVLQSHRPETPPSQRSATVKRRSRRHAHKLSKSSTPDSTCSDSPAYITPTGSGLFPSCLPIVGVDSHGSSKSTALFGFIGRLVGKALVDSRLLDLRFSRTFYRLLLAYCTVFYDKVWSKENMPGPYMRFNGDRRRTGQALPELDTSDRVQIWLSFIRGTSAMNLLEDVDPQLASSLNVILEMARGVQDGSVASLGLSFLLPGDDRIELVKDGRETEVTDQNAEEFVGLVVHHVLFGGVQEQAEALLRGLGEVLDVTSLLTFNFGELDMLLCGPSFEKWTVDFLVQATRCDHGYSHDSPAVLYFLTVLSQMDTDSQQRFVLFATGSPALPLGGLKNLSPRLTIVQRTPEAGRSPDECLPTVMTCTNYFKLPNYSSMEVAQKQIMYAVREGQGSFHLS